MGWFTKRYCAGCGMSYRGDGYQNHLSWCGGGNNADHSMEDQVNDAAEAPRDHMATDHRGYNDFNRPSVPYERIQTTAGVRNYVKQLRAQGWNDDEIRIAFEPSNIDIDRYL